VTEILRDAFDELAGDEPPMRLSVSDIVVHGRRRKARRRIATIAVLTAMVPALGTGLVYATSDPTAAPSVGAVVVPDGSASGSAGSRTGTSRSNAPGSAPTTATSQSPPASIPPTSASPEVSNRLPDPGFEAKPLDWSLFGPATVHTPIDVTHGGAQALRITTTSTERVVAGATNRPVLVRTTTGTRYAASCWVRATGSLAAYVQVQEYTSAWVRVSDPAKSERVMLNDPQRWYQIAVKYTAANTGNQLPLTVFASDMTAGGPALLVDDCSLTIVPGS
jgi:hypothetical protein